MNCPRRIRIARLRLALWALLLAAALPARAQLRDLTILHVNDLHAHLLPDAYGKGGFAQLAAVLRHEREGCRWCIVLNGGDLVQGTPVSTIYQGMPVYELANLLGLDVSVLGNHEFDYGWKKISDFVGAARFPTVAANIQNQKGQLLAPHPYVILTVNGIRVAVIGALTADLPNLTTADLQGPWKALPVVETMRRYAREVRDRSDLIVVLGHLESEEENAILREVPEVSVIVSGHEHDGLENPKQIEHRIAVRVKSFGEEVGRLDLKVNLPAKAVEAFSWRRIPVQRGPLAPADDVAKAVASWESKVTKIVDARIGVAAHAFNREALQPLLERALAEQMGTDLAFVNLGGIRDTLPAGTILARNLWNVMPFDDKVVIGKFRGRELPKAITSRYPVEPDRKYTLATLDYVAVNQKQELGVSGLLFPEKTNRLVRDVLIEWVKHQKILK